ncbi:MAG: phosphotransferase [Spirochaetes bacterium]|nr:phosphotransferase [Spirochaetota bacterium]
MIDIAIKENLEAYLLQRGVIKKADGYTLKYCEGGVSCTVAFVYAGEKPLIIKQGLSKLKVAEEWLCDPNRMGIEYYSNAVYHRLAPDCAPEVYFYDEENYIYGREAVPENCSMWKADLLSGLVDFSVAEKTIRTLALVHNGCAGDKETAARFADKNIFYELRISPYIEFTVGKHTELKDFAKPVIDELMGSAVTLVHGDFSPKNIMVVGRNPSILDYEVAHYGHPSFDIAFVSNHLILKAVKNKQWAGAYISMLNYALDIYFSTIKCLPAKELEKSFVRLLSLLMLARVDGKSPVEYLTLETDKELVRAMAYRIPRQGIDSYKEMLPLFLSDLSQKEKN